MDGDKYFSEREQGEKPRDIEEIGEKFWHAFVGFINTNIERDLFTEKFPINCTDVSNPVECNKEALSSAFKAEINDVSWPFDLEIIPDTLKILDSIEFFARHISKPTRKKFHDFYRHYDIISFDRKVGLAEYQDVTNRFLRRCGHPYILNSEGYIERLTPIVLDQILVGNFRTSDSELNKLLSVAVEKFRDPDLSIRTESLEKLWDAWERLKTFHDSNKKISIKLLLEKAIPEQNLREKINEEAKALTKIGNDFMIRHTETNKIKIDRSEDIDYLFHRLFALVYMLTRNL